jgi:sigma-B regulation protein RsbU (phosphoserine phosphatase)
MTVAPIPRQPSSDRKNAKKVLDSSQSPVFALKELVASLHREQTKIQDLLSSLGFALRSFSNINQFLELTPLMAARVTDAEGGVLLLIKGERQLKVEQMYCQNSQTAVKVRSAFEKVTRQINIRDSNKKGSECVLPSSLDELIRQELGSLVQVYGTPILVKNVERGRIYIFTTEPEFTWTITRRKLSQLVADQTAVAIANHDLTLELRSKERQDRELEIASEIQLRLLPSKCPKIQGVEIAAECKTANRVGGDYYDFIPTNYDRLRQDRDCQGEETTEVPWSIVIADVMGKGVPAGLLMTMTRGMLRAEVLNRYSPAQILQHLNRVMYVDLENSHRFVTLFYSEYDPQTRILSYSNAAHHPPLLWQAKNNTIQKLDTWGMLVGLAPDSQYEDAQIQLEPGDTIIYYTDGFTDAVNSKGERFDEDNLIRVFQSACQQYNNSQDILNYLFESVEKFLGFNNNYSDDMTLVVMKVKDDR